MYSVSIQRKAFRVEKDKDFFKVEGQPINWDLQSIGNSKYHLIYKHKSYNVELLKVDETAKKFTIKLNGKVTELHVKDRFDLLLERLGMNNKTGPQVKNIIAPMPGLIFEIRVKEGDKVKKGDPLLILEAMKMENIIKSPGDGEVKKIMVKNGDSVEKNKVLIQF
ncbi:acetyl-CoA carboxylase biotin carboxyl carrier protein subunit [Echinicola jeungdonensis]|uniref:Acetyl-CoA carboxylase biotin carboxyl carrier protein subunit n=1 Tax=Echinicola jeungdonensis TaxID=709343 RepID=A0ABV5J142_9BACT|nr:acetyl-CoA carboxylase biotin carboxyl carrier protein subunit [Echinicola jeungdonensis]MDN3668376.1 acetyl-CoA carboxylase biotin carboxyl carrier protein subunit [Echinicola jeungdonensis]